MAHFRNKPVVIEAVQLTWANWSAICEFVPKPWFRRGVWLDADGFPRPDKEWGTGEDDSQLGLYIENAGKQFVSGERRRLDYQGREGRVLRLQARHLRRNLRTCRQRRNRRGFQMTAPKPPLAKRVRLEKTMSLAGQTETITAMQFRAAPGDVLLQAQMGKTFNITKHGVVIAVLSAPELNALELGAEIRRLRLIR